MDILVIKLSSYGDIFHALPAVHAISSKFGVKVDWVTQTEYVDLVRCFPDVGEVIPFHRHSFLSNYSSFRQQIRRKRYDLVVDLHGIFKSAIVTGMARGERKIGPSCWRELAVVCYDEVAGDRNTERHAVDQLLDSAKYLGADISNPVFPVSFPEYKLDAAKPRIAIAPWSRWETKNWPLDNFTAVGKALAEKRKASIYIIGGPSDKDAGEKLAAAIGGGAVSLCGKLALPQTGGFLKQCDLLIANDSGPVHMAVAVNTPVVVLFGPTDPKKIGPYNGRNTVLTAPLDCRPCSSRCCKSKDYRCMRDIVPGIVIEAALKYL